MNKTVFWIVFASLAVSLAAGLWQWQRAVPVVVTTPPDAVAVTAAVSPKTSEAPKAPAEAAPVFDWAAGERRQTYRYLVESKVQVNATITQQDAQWQEIALNLQGTLNVRVFDRIDDKIYLGFQISPLSVRHAGQEVPKLEQLYGRFFMAEVSPQGQFLKFYFPAYLTNAEEQAAISELVYPAQIVLPAPKPPALPPDHWDSTESHGSGHYTARYQWRDGLVHKEKTAYTALSDVAGKAWEGLKLKGEVLASHSEIHLGKPWLESLSQQERLRFSSEYGKLSEIVSQFELRRVAGPLNAALDIWKMPDDPRQVREQLAALRVPASGDANVFEAMRLDRLREKFAGVQVGSLLDGLLQGGETADQFVEQLEEYLKAYPESAAELAQRLKQNLYSEQVTAGVIYALAEAGNLPAQQALLALMDDTREAARAQVTQAIMSAGGVAHPEPVLTDGLWQRIASRATEYDTAMLALGRLGATLEQSGDVVTAQQIRERLGGYLQQAEAGSHDQELALRGLANTQSQQAYPLVEPYLRAENPGIRAAAHRALGTLDDPVSRATLLDSVAHDPASLVRQSALESLARRPDQANPETVAAVAKRLPDESDRTLRTTMIQFLGTHKTVDPAAIATLQQQLSQETDRDMLKQVYKALYQPADAHQQMP